jgi:hypothetical protein
LVSKRVSVITTITILATAITFLIGNNNNMAATAQQILPSSVHISIPNVISPFSSPYPYLHGYPYPGWIENWLGPRLEYYLPPRPPQPPHNNVIISPPPTGVIPPNQVNSIPILPSPLPQPILPPVNPSIIPVPPPVIIGPPPGPILIPGQNGQNANGANGADANGQSCVSVGGSGCTAGNGGIGGAGGAGGVGGNGVSQSCPLGYQRDIYGNCVLV